MMLKNILLARSMTALAVLVLAQPLLAEQPNPAAEKVRQGVARVLPDLQIDEVTLSPVPGLYEVVIGQRLVYVTEDGRYLLQGNLVDLQQQKNLTEPRLNDIKARALSEVSEDSMVIFGPEDAKHTVTVFTDIDCGYCRKLHGEMAKYNDAGIRVRYLFFPRAGVDSPSYRKAVSVWCADNRNEAMTVAKTGATLEDRDCPNPVREHMALGQQMGVTGTPALVLESGAMVPGYVPAERLLGMLEQQEN